MATRHICGTPGCELCRREKRKLDVRDRLKEVDVDPAETFVKRLYSLCPSGTEDRLADHCFEWMDERFRRGEWDLVRAALRRVDFGELTVQAVVSLLCSSYPWRDDRLDRELAEAYKAAYDSADVRLTQLCSGDRVERLLKGLRP